MKLRSAALLLLTLSCSKDDPVRIDPTVRVDSIPGHEGLVDTAPKQGPRLLEPETYLRTYIALFGNISPEEIQAAAKGPDRQAEFDDWKTYAPSLGLPDHPLDIPRAPETNTLMLATYERLAIAMCDRAAQADLRDGTTRRRVFDFEAGADKLDRTAFESRFDVVHRTFLAYPAKLAVAGRTDRFYAVYARAYDRAKAVSPARKITPQQTAWAVVCYGLARHPEFQTY